MVMFLEFFGWWYGRGWRDAWLRPRWWLERVGRQFSIPVLLRTLFSPWRQIISFPGRSLDQRLRAALDNLVSRVIGFLVRLLVLIAAGLLMLLVSLIAVLMALIWPFVPLLIVACLYGSIAG